MKRIGILLQMTLLCTMQILAQSGWNGERIPYDKFEREWADFRYQSKEDMGVLQRYYKDTVTVAEMTENFYVNYNKRTNASPYAGLDSVVYGIRGEYVLLTSPLNRSSIKGLQGKRGVWKWGKRFLLYQILDKRGVSQDALLKKIIAGRDSLAWMKGDFVTLRSPRHYMGFIVSPRVYMQTYSESQLIGSCGNIECPADFFSFAGPTYVMDGDWYHKTRGGAEYLSKMLTLYCYPNKGTEERTFSVLLYKKPDSSRIKSEYTLKLLLPVDADNETNSAFEKLKRFVENLRNNAFNPFYTTDFRVMTGRYYRVTYNKCGWLVEDYLDITKTK